MAIISLRAYNREIEGLIDNGQLDEAVAHCRHILTTFPKHITTYRLLGKTHLEQQRISDATDIFQRVLSAIPDDFIANVGMSIIREDENNLDASIWHMELAYEGQPANTAIQDELRRLYGRRDGMQPPKLRLTRGALARMYAKGGLLDQAVAELRSAISEDPNRYDLQLLLASMYFQSTLRVDAVDTCVNILKKLPFCLAANQILAVTLPETDQSGTGKDYRQVAMSMDPYFAHAAQDAITSDQVPENSVNIERLEWKSGIRMSEVTAQPTWATSLGVSLDKKPDEVLPEWLKGTEAPETPEPVENAQPSVSPFIWDTQEVERIITDDNKSEGEIPDWMKDAGWKPASIESVQKPAEVPTEPPIINIQPEEDLEKAEIPDWLRGIALEDVVGTEPASSQPKEKDVSLPWLEKQQPGPTDSIIQWLEDAKPETPVTPPAEEIPVEISEEEIPDWLKDLETPNPIAEQGEQTAEESTAIPIAVPAFIEGLVIAEAVKSQETKELPSDEQLEQVEKIEIIPELVETPASTEISETGELPAAFADELPDWIKELAGETPEGASTALPVEESEFELPTITPEEQPAEEIPSDQPEMPSVEPLVAVEETSMIEKPIIEMEESITTLPVDSEEQGQIEEPLVIEKETNEDASGISGENAALAWLTGLAIQESTKEEEQVTPVEGQQATTLESVGIETEATLDAAIPEIESKEEETPALPAEEIPDWIKGLGEAPEIEEVAIEPGTDISLEPEAQPAEEIPAWLIGSALAVEEIGATEAPQETLEKEEVLPDWINEIAETTPTEEAPIAPELPVTKILPTLPTELSEEWASEAAPVAESEEVKTLETQPQEADWVSIAGTSQQSELAGPIEKEVESTTFAPELSVVPTVETSEVEAVTLEDAQNALNQGLPAQAAEVFTGLVKQNQQLEEVIKEVQEALYRFPVDVNLWVVLGDAYLHTDELQDALDAYSKAEDLVR